MVHSPVPTPSLFKESFQESEETALTGKHYSEATLFHPKNLITPVFKMTQYIMFRVYIDCISNCLNGLTQRACTSCKQTLTCTCWLPSWQMITLVWKRLAVGCSKSGAHAGWLGSGCITCLCTQLPALVSLSWCCQKASHRNYKFVQPLVSLCGERASAI